MKWPVSFLGPIVLFAAGCGDDVTTRSPSADTAAVAFLGRSAPDDAVSIAAVVERLAGTKTDADSDTNECVVQGVIYAGEHDPFQTDSAVFLMSELPDPTHGDGTLDHADNCPFCKRRAEKATKAMVEFRGDDGELISTPADELFGLTKGDRVTVTGHCRFDEAMNLVTIQATKIYNARANAMN